MKSYYFYYQTNEKETWKLGVDTAAGRQEAINGGARRISALSLDRQIDQDTDLSKIRYRGPFYVDIDCKDHLQSIRSAQAFLQKLVDMDVSERHFEIYCSGTKGFHFYLHQKLFYNGWAVINLPAVYKSVAKALYVYGLDYQVYCGGKGNLLRVPGKRADGRYKRRILPDTLMDMDVAQYIELTTSAEVENLAVMPMQTPAAANPYCMSLFQAAQSELKAFARPAKSPVAEEALAEFKQQPPPCVDDLCEGKFRKQTNFNQVSMQLAVFSVRTGINRTLRDGLFQRLAKNSESTTYATPYARVQHADGLARYMEGHDDVKFSCPAMRNVISTNPCETCILGEKQGTAEDLDNFEIVERHDGYHHLGDKGASRRLTSFLILPYQTIYTPQDDIEDMYSGRSHIMAFVEQNGIRHHAPISLSEDCWNSRSAFIATFSGISNLAVFCTDVDVQRLKHYVLKEMDDLDQQVGVRTVGIQRSKFNKKPLYTWVEDSFSVNKWGMRDTHLYIEPTAQYDQAALPRFTRLSQPDTKKYDYVTLIQALININEPSAIAPLMGWLSAAVLRSHFMGIWMQFPLMMLWGGRGSGKTRTASMLAGMHGCDYWTNAPPTLASGTTDFALFSVCSSTTTVVRVLDEFNRHGMRSGRYEHVSEIFKAAFNNNAIAKGRLRQVGEKGGRGGGVVEHHQITSPLLLLGEHAPEVPALLDRLYLIQLKEPSIVGRQQYMDYILQHRDRLQELGKAMAMQALHIHDDWVEDRMEEWRDKIVDTTFTERQRYSRQAIGVGIDFLRMVLLEVLKLPLEKELDWMKEAYLVAISGGQKAVAQQTGFLTEVDRMMTELGTLMAAAKAGVSSMPVSSNVIWTERTVLYMDVQLAFFYLEQSYINKRKALPVRHAEQFKRLLASESYFLKEVLVAERVANRTCVALSLTRMADKGIDVSLFK